MNQQSHDEVIAKVLERKVELSSKYVVPHNQRGRIVTKEDVPRVLSDAKIMHEMCLVGRGIYSTAYAIAHTQICDSDPLRFYVTDRGMIMINPVILSHTNFVHEEQEGCMSYPEEPMIIVGRFNKVTLRYQTLIARGGDDDDLVLSDEIEETFNGKKARVVQHETSHLNGANIYDDDFTPLKAIGV